MGVDDQLAITGGITQALLAALDQVHTAVTKNLQGPDGEPLGSAVYMHMPVGHPVDPSMYSYAWTPNGGSTAATVTSTGTFAAAPTPEPQKLPGDTPAAQLAAKPAVADPVLEHAIYAAYNTSQLVDHMLLMSKGGVATSWPDRTVSLAYEAVLAGMQAEAVDPPPPDVQARIDAAQKLLYVMNDKGEMTGYTPKYASYRHNRKAVDDAVTAYAAAYASAMTDPVQGQAWPVASAKYQGDVDATRADLDAMGGHEVEEAIATLQSIGGSAAAELIARARKMRDAYAIGLSGAIADKQLWSYIDPVSWWDPNDKDMGVMHIDVESSAYAASGSGDTHQFSNSFYHDTSTSTSGSAGFSIGLFSVGANASHSSSENDWGGHGDQSSHDRHADSSSSAKVSFEWFLATIERPWLVGDLFHMDGWYTVGGKAGCISDGTLEGNLNKPDTQDRTDKLLPMVPKGFIIIRNVVISANDWGSAGDAFSTAVQESAGHTDASSTSFGGSVGWCGLGGSVQHTESDANGAFSSSADTGYGWSYSSNGKAGTLSIHGAQIVGWIGEIQPKAPRKDAPEGAKKDDAGTAPASTGTTAPAAGQGTSSDTTTGAAAPVPVPTG